MPTTNDVYVVGVTRFSLLLPNASQWKLSAQAESGQAYAERLYDPKRLDARLQIFAGLSVPQLAAGCQDLNYRHIVQHSSTLPVRYQEALQEIANRFDFLRIVCSDDPKVHSGAVANQFRDMVDTQDRENARLAWFRLDDDDIVSDRYFSRIVPYIEFDPPGRVISLGLGYSMIYSDSMLWDLRRDYRPKNSIGQLYLCAFDCDGEKLIEPPRQNHAIIDQFAPTILDSRHPSFITVVHPLQDGRSHLDLGDALAAVEREQGLKPIAPLEDLDAEFSLVKDSGFISDELGVFIESQPQLSTSPEVFPLSARGNLTIELAVTASQAQSEGRVIIGLKFATGTRPAARGRWVEIDKSTLAVGFVVSEPKMSFRAYLLDVPDSCELESVSVWVSRSFAGEIKLDSLSIA